MIKDTLTPGLKKIESKVDARASAILDNGERVLKVSVARETPVDTSRLVNSLRADTGRAVVTGPQSIRLQKNAPQKKDVIRITRKTGKRYARIFGTNVPYAPFVEYGTSRAKSNPFFRRGLNKAWRDAVKAMASAAKM